jgi:uncharacterized protein YndB with AHSA1/START domain
MPMAASHSGSIVEPTVRHATFSIDREFTARPDAVFAAFANPAAKARWFAPPLGWQAAAHSLDFRIGGVEHLQVATPDGTLHAFDAVYEDIVPSRRIVFTYQMHVGEVRMSVSLTTIELFATRAGTRLILTEQGAFLDSLDSVEARERGTHDLLDKLDAELRRASQQ